MNALLHSLLSYLVLAPVIMFITHLMQLTPPADPKGETKFGVLYTEGNEFEFVGGEVHFATAINNKVAVMVNGLSVSREDDVMDYQGNGTSKEKGRGSYVEFAGGIFKSV